MGQGDNIYHGIAENIRKLTLTSITTRVGRMSRQERVQYHSLPFAKHCQNASDGFVCLPTYQVCTFAVKEYGKGKKLPVASARVQSPGAARIRSQSLVCSLSESKMEPCFDHKPHFDQKEAELGRTAELLDSVAPVMDLINAECQLGKDQKCW